MARTRYRNFLISVAVFCLVGSVAAAISLALPNVLSWIANSTDSWAVTTRLLAPLLMCGAVALWAARRVKRRLDQPLDKDRPVEPRTTLSLRLGRVALAAVALAYLATWAFGVPAVQSELARQTVQGYKLLQGHSDASRLRHYPYLGSAIAFPLAPGIIVTYYEYQIAGLNGLGAWYFHAWYFTGVKEIGRWERWIS